MTNSLETIDQTTLERLVEANSVHEANVVARVGGWGVIIKYGMTERVLAVRRGTVRLWVKLETLVAFLCRIGIARFYVDATGYDAQAKPLRERADASERLRVAHEAAAYDKRFRALVQESLDDPRPNVSQEEAQKHMQVKKAALRKQLAKSKF